MPPPGSLRTQTQTKQFPSPLFGTASRGAHLTLYTRRPSTGLHIWVARRAPTLHTYPGMLDTTVAGGVQAASTPRGCVAAEAAEEAGLDREWVAREARAAGCVSYVARRPRRQGGDDDDDDEALPVTPTVLYVFDLEVGPDVQPRPEDGEVVAFYLWDVARVCRAMAAGEFKPNCNLVMLDFFVRHGIVTPENEPGYVDIVARLHRPLPVPTAPPAAGAV